MIVWLMLVIHLEAPPDLKLEVLTVPVAPVCLSTYDCPQETLKKSETERK